MTVDFTKPIQTRAGHPVRILCTDRKDNDGYPVVGLVLEGGQEHLKSWTAEGAYRIDRSCDEDIIQAPKPRKHADLIKRWVEDASMRIKVKREDGRWSELSHPAFYPTYIYEEILPGDPLY